MTTFTIRIMRADDAVEVVSAQTEPTLEQLRAWVGGNIELITFPHGAMYVNEDGIRLDLPRNWRASMICLRAVLGDVVVVTKGHGLTTVEHKSNVTGNRVQRSFPTIEQATAFFETRARLGQDPAYVETPQSVVDLYYQATKW